MKYQLKANQPCGIGSLSYETGDIVSTHKDQWAALNARREHYPNPISMPLDVVEFEGKPITELEMKVRNWLRREKYVSTGNYSAKILADKLGVSSQKVFATMRGASKTWCKVGNFYHSTRYGDSKKVMTYRPKIQA